MVKRACVEKVSESYFLFNISSWQVHEIPSEVYLEVKAVELPFSCEQTNIQWVSPEMRKEIEQWIQ